MLLQPIIENSIRHGLSSKVDGGMIRVRSYLADGRLHLVVEDDGVGIPETRLATLFEQGIGVSNVNERMKVLFGPDYRMWIDSKPGEGTRTGIEIPDVQVASEVGAGSPRPAEAWESAEVSETTPRHGPSLRQVLATIGTARQFAAPETRCIRSASTRSGCACSTCCR